MYGYRSILLIVLLACGVLHARKYVPGEEYDRDEMVKVRIVDLHPTQFALGFDEVEYRKMQSAHLVALSKKERKKELKKAAGRVVIGPGGKLYLIDGHHHAAAYDALGMKQTFVRIDRDWSHLSEKEFWKRMENKDESRKRARVYLKDENGKARKHSELPKNIRKMANNPYRSIVFFLIKLGHIHKDKETFPPHGEFRYVDALRANLELDPPELLHNMGVSVTHAARYVTGNHPDVRGLPGQRKMPRTKCNRLLKGMGLFVHDY